MTYEPIMRPGLQGVIAAETRLSYIDGLAGELIIGGYALEEIAPYVEYEEMLYLLWNDRLPDATQLQAFREKLAERRNLHPAILDLLRAAAQEKTPVMDALRMAAGLLNLNAPSDDEYELAMIILAKIPTIIAAYWRLQHAQKPIAPDESLSHVANYLYMLDGEQPSAERIRALNTYFNTVIDHGFNASTFTARVITSTHSDLVSAISGAIGALKGPLHGGAPGPALDTVFEIGTAERAESVLRSRLEAGERLMGFGHRVYKVRDPRADVLNAAAERLYRSGEQQALYDLARHVEQVALALLEEYKPGRNLQTNVEFYTALLLHGVGLETSLFTPSFAAARAGGWVAHAIEHLHHGRILRPLAQYTGEKGLKLTPDREPV